MSINDLISSIRDLHSSFSWQYICLNAILEKGIATAEIMKFKESIDDLKDVASDLESRFFFLPKIENFQETSKELSLLYMNIFCLEDFKVQFEKLKKKNAYSSIEEDTIAYFFGKQMHQL